MDFDGFRDGDAFQVFAEVEGIFSDFFQLRALCEGHSLQVLTFLEGALFDELNACRDVHFFQFSIGKCAFWNTLNFLKERYLCQVFKQIVISEILELTLVREYDFAQP